MQEQIKDKLVNAIQQEMENQFGDGGANYDQSSSYARLVNERHHSRLVGLIDDAKEKGAKVTYGGQTKDDENYLAPTLLENISRDSTIASEEIFGPILTIDTFRNLEEAVEKIKMHPKPLSMYIFSKKQKNINHFLQHVSAGGVSINETVLHLTHPYLPFGGVNHSGIGKAHGKYGFIEFSNQKSVLKQKSGLTSAMILLPPYPKAKKFVDLFINAIVKLRL